LGQHAIASVLFALSGGHLEPLTAMATNASVITSAIRRLFSLDVLHKE
jgi:hypothetical protein